MKQINLQTKEQITISELIVLYKDIYNNVKNYYEIEDTNIKECISKLNKDWKKINMEITEKIENLSKKIMQENSISLDIYRKTYQRNLAVFISDIHFLKEFLKKDLVNIIDDTENLSKSII